MCCFQFNLQSKCSPTYFTTSLWDVIVRVTKMSITSTSSKGTRTCNIIKIWCTFFWVFPRRLNIKSRRFGTLCRINLHRWVGVNIHTYPPVKTEPKECSETSAFNIQTPEKYPEESTSYLQHGESLKTTIIKIIMWAGSAACLGSWIFFQNLRQTSRGGGSLDALEVGASWIFNKRSTVCIT
jgi:hypothetical protein